MSNDAFITKEALIEAGITISNTDDMTALLNHLNATLEERVGSEIVESLDDNQVSTFVKMQENASDIEINAWLESNVPELEQIVQDEIDILLSEIIENEDIINSFTQTTNPTK